MTSAFRATAHDDRSVARTLADLAVAPTDDRIAAAVRAAALVLGGTLLTAAAAQLSVRMPWTEVPYTGQTAAVLLVGVSLGARLGLASMLLYLLAGAAGAPLFSGGAAGVEQLFGVTAGYLLGFLLAAALVGHLAERGWDREPRRAALLMLLGNLVIYAVGVPVLAVAAGLGPVQAIGSGALVFLPWDLVKIAVAALVLPLTWRLARGR
jgi:biotin transport system substrate-specific component